MNLPVPDNLAAAENFENILENISPDQVTDIAKTILAEADVVDIIFKPKPE